MRAILIFFLPFALLAQDPDDVAREQQLNKAATAGKAIFQQNCGFCHGPDARGASGPDLIRSTLVNHDVAGNLIGPVVHNGRPEKGMPAFQLSDDQIQEIAAFLHNQAKHAASVAQRIPSEYPLKKLLVGDPSAGRAYFEGKGGCTHCHSVSGDLQHIATKYTPFDLQTRIAFPAGAKPTVTVKDAQGNTYSGEETYADEFFVTLRDRSGWEHTWNRKSVSMKIDDPLAAHEKLLQQYTDADLHNVFAYLETFK